MFIQGFVKARKQGKLRGDKKNRTHLPQQLQRGHEHNADSDALVAEAEFNREADEAELGKGKDTRFEVDAALEEDSCASAFIAVAGLICLPLFILASWEAWSSSHSTNTSPPMEAIPPLERSA
jgi:hypothetical protein